MCSSSVFRSRISVYLLGSLPPDIVTKWLPAPSQLIDPWCSSAFSFIVFYWCACKWLSCTLSADICSFECTNSLKSQSLFTLKTQHLEACGQFTGDNRNLILPPTQLLYSFYPLLSGITLSQINQPMLPLGSRGKARKGGIYGAGAINRWKGLIDLFGHACVCVSLYLCHFIISHATYP